MFIKVPVLLVVVLTLLVDVFEVFVEVLDEPPEAGALVTRAIIGGTFDSSYCGYQV